MNVTLTDREAGLMEVLWEHGPSTVSEVRERLSDDLAYTTVLTILRNLEAKGYLTHIEEGRAHRYAAAIERDHAERSALRALKRKLFRGSAELLLARLVSDEKLTRRELDRIRQLLEERTKRTGSGK